VLSRDPLLDCHRVVVLLQRLFLSMVTQKEVSSENQMIQLMSNHDIHKLWKTD